MSSKFGISYNTTTAFWLSVVLYLFIIFFIFFKLSRYEESIKYTNDLDAFMDVYVVDTNLAQNIVSPEQKDKKIDEKKVEDEMQSPTQTAQKTTNKDLPPPEPDKPNLNFSDLFSQAAPIEITPNTTQAIQSNAKSDLETNLKTAADIIASLQKDINTKAPKSSMTGVYNKYMGDIVEIIQSRWIAYKADTNNQAKVKVIIDEFGKLSYSIDEYSLNSAFNSKVREYLERLKDLEFPIPPSKNSIVINVNLIDQIETELE
ncbi:MULTISPECIES: TonB C-terminal domain-containing protein [Campylobacter]|uniref:TonB C-terminal domain-containing protein n=1 Tax=Campylobacter porcelli TaxID=1660073 RepID=A0ABU7M6T7_9BACT|nr:MULTISPECIES: TonB C-terminal domain-containing protein [unclassified Campylobacter]MCR8679357.1 TonB C-terminal domain-containing protein [Campylobacter sp. RM19072]MEE3705211.1 TonB C-terminal domain-containing protein [Campylobacter sp. CX2-8023-23]MEE3744903.1 TonB C-terminal domain-containing protein [Campylobacter sp. CX2-4855-23]